MNEINERHEIITEIKILIHSLIMIGTNINFVWIPWHCGILYNDLADKLTKQGSKNINSISVDINVSIKEQSTKVEQHFKKDMNKSIINKNLVIEKRQV